MHANRPRRVLCATNFSDAAHAAMLHACAVARDVDAALEPLMTAAALAPDRAPVRASLAAALRRKGSLAEAEREYREALRADPAWLPALRGLGVLLLATDRPADAVEPLRTALAAAPADSDTLLALARAQRLSGDLAGAGATLAAAASGRDATLLNEAGAVAYAEGRWGDAQALFEKARAADTALAVAAGNLGKASAAARVVAALAAAPPPAPAPKR